MGALATTHHPLHGIGSNAAHHGFAQRTAQEIAARSACLRLSAAATEQAANHATETATTEETTKWITRSLLSVLGHFSGHGSGIVIIVVNLGIQAVLLLPQVASQFAPLLLREPTE
jgi:hypothetical protein